MGKLVRLLFVFLLAGNAATLCQAQDLTGIWRGYFLTEGGEQYKYEVQLGQSKKNTLSGVTYSYLDTRFYGKATFTGNFTRTTNAALVQEIKTVEVKMSTGSVACIMKCRLVYSKSGNEEFLEGAYASMYEKTDAMGGVRRGGNCGGGQVFLRKVPTSDFYVEPFLRNKKTTTPATTDVARTPVTRKPPSKPAPKSPVVKKETPLVKKSDNKPVVVETPAKKPAEITVNSRPVERKVIVTPPTIRERKNELTKLVTVNSTEVMVSLYDNGEIDGDTVSIYLDGSLILSNKRLSNKPITYTLKFDEATPEHTLVMVAENMGSIPPNTSLMMVQDGDKRYQASITSTDQKNAMVRFRYERSQ